MPLELRSLIEACLGTRVHLAGTRLHLPGPLTTRLSVVAGNLRLHRLMDRMVHRGATVVDAGANIGYNTAYASALVGPTGRIVAVEPASDNVRVLRENIAANALANVAVHHVALGRTHEVRDLFLRGETSAVNSLFQGSVYSTVTGVESVTVVPLDDLVDGVADLVKIDVEGAELDVIGGMTRMLRHPGIQLIVEWHPQLQEAAGYRADALPRCLLEHGFELCAASHSHVRRLTSGGIDALATELRGRGRPVELVATRRP